MKGRLFALVSALSLLLLVAVVVLWVRSYQGGGSTFPRQPSAAGTYVHSFRGVLRLRVCDSDHPVSVGGGVGMAVYRPLPGEMELRADRSREDVIAFDHGFVHVAVGSSDGGRSMAYAPKYVPFWSVSVRHRHLLAMTGLPVLCWLTLLGWRQRQYRRQQLRRMSGLCTSCGYDLRASKDRCPECATPIPQKSESCSQGERL